MKTHCFHKVPGKIMLQMKEEYPYIVVKSLRIILIQMRFYQLIKLFESMHFFFILIPLGFTNDRVWP